MPSRWSLAHSASSRNPVSEVTTCRAAGGRHSVSAARSRSGQPTRTLDCMSGREGESTYVKDSLLPPCYKSREWMTGWIKINLSQWTAVGRVKPHELESYERSCVSSTTLLLFITMIQQFWWWGGGCGLIPDIVRTWDIEANKHNCTVHYLPLTGNKFPIWKHKAHHHIRVNGIHPLFTHSQPIS